MSEKSTFFNSVSGDRKYKAEDMALHFSKVLTNGVMPSGTQLQATADSGMNIVVSAGSAWINGYAYHNDSNFTLTIDPADGVLNRIDRIVVRWSRLNRAINLVVIKGVAASSPSAPAIVRGVDSYDLGIATISVGNGITSITQAMITDTRANSSVCGFVSSLIQPDTSGWFAQFDAAFNDAINTNQGDWDAWFATIQDVIDENTAGNLLNLITALDSDKADKAVPTADGNLAGLDATGNLVDSGKSVLDLQPNKNLLDVGLCDWLFTDPKNRMGLTSYTTDGYVLDYGWTSYLINVDLTAASGLNLTTRMGVDACLWRQAIPIKDLSKTYTFSVLIGNTVYSVTGVPSTGATKVIIPNTAYLSISYSDVYVAVTIGVSQGATLSGVKAVKLEYGSKQTLVRYDANGDVVPITSTTQQAYRRIPETAGNIAALDARGNLLDAGIAPAGVYRRISLPSNVNIRDYLRDLGYSGCGQAVPSNTGTPVASQYWAFVIHWATSGRVVLEMFQAGSAQNRYYCTNTDGTWSGWYKLTATAV